MPALEAILAAVIELAAIAVAFAAAMFGRRVESERAALDDILVPTAMLGPLPHRKFGAQHGPSPQQPAPSGIVPSVAELREALVGLLAGAAADGRRLGRRGARAQLRALGWAVSDKRVAATMAMLQGDGDEDHPDNNYIMPASRLTGGQSVPPSAGRGSDRVVDRQTSSDPAASNRRTIAECLHKALLRRRRRTPPVFESLQQEDGQWVVTVHLPPPPATSKRDYGDSNERCATVMGAAKAGSPTQAADVPLTFVSKPRTSVSEAREEAAAAALAALDADQRAVDRKLRKQLRVRRVRGRMPNMQWRAIPMEHVRLHPLFTPLPPPGSVSPASARDLCFYRQDTWEWDALHSGRLTSSSLSGVLGLLEPAAAAKLGVPRSLMGHHKALSAFERLSREQDPNFASFTSPPPLIMGGHGVHGGELMGNDAASSGWPPRPPPRDNAATTSSKKSDSAEVLWPPRKAAVFGSRQNLAQAATPYPPSSRCFPGGHEGRGHGTMPPPTNSYNPPQSRRHGRRQGAGADGEDGRDLHIPTDGFAARMMWGSTQEPVSIVTAINYFSALGGAVEESGMLPLEGVGIDAATIAAVIAIGGGKYGGGRVDEGISCGQDEAVNLISKHLPPIGASPDGLVRWPDGTVDVFEAKNCCPLIDTMPRRRNGNKGNDSARNSGRSQFFHISDPGPYESLAPWHIPQLQLEMLCAGPQCRAAHLLSCSATLGCSHFIVERDEVFISLMLKVVAMFYREFVQEERLPPVNFFADHPTHQALVERTKALAEAVTVAAHIPADAVQRSPHPDELFLDDMAPSRGLNGGQKRA